MLVVGEEKKRKGKVAGPDRAGRRGNAPYMANSSITSHDSPACEAREQVRPHQYLFNEGRKKRRKIPSSRAPVESPRAHTHTHTHTHSHSHDQLFFSLAAESSMGFHLVPRRDSRSSLEFQLVVLGVFFSLQLGTLRLPSNGKSRVMAPHSNPPRIATRRQMLVFSRSFCTAKASMGFT